MCLLGQSSLDDLRTIRLVPIDPNDHDERAARINVMLEELRLNTEDLHELAKQEIYRSWKASRAARVRADDDRGQNGSQPTKKTREP
jgi:hypothetical protein